MNTNDVLVSMLKENTGSSMLDSGGAYGRNWQRNQGRDFESEPYAQMEFNTYRDWKTDKLIPDIMITRSTYHYLSEHLDYDAKMDRRLQTIIDNSDYHTSYDECIDMFFDRLRAISKRMGWDGRSNLLTGPEGSGEPVGENSYNSGSSLLDQTIQYTYFDWDGDPFVVLQIHGGCDVRGGYTAPRVFRMSESYALNFDSDASVYCPNCRASWDTDDAYHFYFEGSTRDSEYGFENLIPFMADEYDEHEATMAESTIKRFGLSFYNKQADRIDRIKVGIYRLLTAPHRLMQSIVNWSGKATTDKRRATLRVWAYGPNNKYIGHYWRYPSRYPRIARVASAINKRMPVVRRPNLSKRYLLINDGKATCPVCAQTELTIF